MKIIVDKLPKNKSDCLFSRFMNGEHYCLLRLRILKYDDESKEVVFKTSPLKCIFDEKSNNTCPYIKTFSNIHNEEYLYLH